MSKTRATITITHDDVTGEVKIQIKDGLKSIESSRAMQIATNIISTFMEVKNESSN